MRVRYVKLDNEIQELDFELCYEVIALRTWPNGKLMVYLHSIPEQHFPIPYTAELFEFLDTDVPHGWYLEIEKSDTGLALTGAGFKEWVRDDRFYERLVDADYGAMECYQRHLKVMEGRHKGNRY